MEHIHFILTGGTIDSVYNSPTEKMIPAPESCIPDYIQNVIKPHVKASFETLCMLDSGDLDDALRAKILDHALKAPSDKIIIAHGTNTMTKTLDFLNGKTGDKTIVLTGAMVPLKEMVLSDGGFNLGYAIAQVQSLPPGAYICMNAETFEVGCVVKDVTKARFVVKK